MEQSRRGIYAGALGLIDVDGYVNLALCIRTLVHHDGAYRIRAIATDGAAFSTYDVDVQVNAR